MKWITKSITQKLLSLLPQGERVNHFLQRHITRLYPVPEQTFRDYIRVATDHFTSFHRFVKGVPLSNVRFLEFGAGWDLQMAVLFSALGVPHQTVIDVRPLLQLDLVNHNLQRLRRGRETYERLLGYPLQRLPEGEICSLDDLKRVLGIHYQSPVRFQDSKLKSGAFHFISTSAVFEHIPEGEFPEILAECRRVLDPQGIFSIDIDMQDHGHAFDPSIGPHHFLRYSDRTWRFFQSKISFQNRLRLPDYVQLLEKAGFEILNKTVWPCSPEEMVELKRMPLAKRFQKYTDWDGLGAKVVNLAVQPVPGPLP